ncbi:hypothetical protein BJX99DRAFT_154220 [Aspergillus californicus]
MDETSHKHCKKCKRLFPISHYTDNCTEGKSWQLCKTCRNSSKHSHRRRRTRLAEVCSDRDVRVVTCFVADPVLWLVMQQALAAQGLQTQEAQQALTAAAAVPTAFPTAATHFPVTSPTFDTGFAASAPILHPTVAAAPTAAEPANYDPDGELFSDFLHLMNEDGSIIQTEPGQTSNTTQQMETYPQSYPNETTPMDIDYPEPVAPMSFLQDPYVVPEYNGVDPEQIAVYPAAPMAPGYMPDVAMNPEHAALLLRFLQSSEGANDVVEEVDTAVENAKTAVEQASYGAEQVDYATEETNFAFDPLNVAGEEATMSSMHGSPSEELQISPWVDYPAEEADHASEQANFAAEETTLNPYNPNFTFDELKVTAVGTDFDVMTSFTHEQTNSAGEETTMTSVPASPSAEISFGDCARQKRREQG